MIVDQAAALRQMVASCPADAAQPSVRHRGGRTIAVTSGKGGVGKTTVAVNLAVQLARMKRRVVLLDADLGTANADVLCNLAPSQNLAHVITGRMPIEDAMVTGPGGFFLIPGASGLGQVAAMAEADRNHLVCQMHRLESSADVILIDTGAGINPNVLGFLLAADEILVVTTPEPTAMTDAYAVIKTIYRQVEHREGCHPPPIWLLVNMVHDGREARQVYDRVAAVCTKFLNTQLLFAGQIDLDGCVRNSIHRRRPFVLESPSCAASASIVQLAYRIERNVAHAPSTSLLRRMAMWLAR